MHAMTSSIYMTIIIGIMSFYAGTCFYTNAMIRDIQLELMEMDDAKRNRFNTADKSNRYMDTVSFHILIIEWDHIFELFGRCDSKFWEIFYYIALLLLQIGADHRLHNEHCAFLSTSVYRYIDSHLHVCHWVEYFVWNIVDNIDDCIDNGCCADFHFVPIVGKFDGRSAWDWEQLLQLRLVSIDSKTTTVVCIAHSTLSEGVPYDWARAGRLLVASFFIGTIEMFVF